jgi:hypothetical protein
MARIDVDSCEHRTVETGLLRDSDWAPLDGEVCRVTSLRSMGFAKPEG